MAHVSCRLMLHCACCCTNVHDLQPADAEGRARLPTSASLAANQLRIGLDERRLSRADLVHDAAILCRMRCRSALCTTLRQVYAACPLRQVYVVCCTTGFLKCSCYHDARAGVTALRLLCVNWIGIGTRRSSHSSSTPSVVRAPYSMPLGAHHTPHSMMRVVPPSCYFRASSA